MNHHNTNTVQSISGLEALLLQASVGIAIFRGENLVIELVNDTMLSYWGRTREQAQNTPLWELLPEAKAQGFDKIAAEVYRTAQAFSSEETPVTLVRNGQPETIFVRFGFQPRFDDDGKVMGILAITNDVTEQVVARKKLEQSEAYFRRIIDAIPCSIWITDKDGLCTFLSREWYEYTGQSREHALGFGWLDVIHADDKQPSAEVFLHANEARERFTIRYRLRTKSGAYRWCTDSGTPKFDIDGNFEGFIGCVIDVHEEKISTDRIRGAEQRLFEAHEKLRIATESATVGTWSLDVRSGILDWSPLHKRLWGYNDRGTELHYEDWHKIILDEDKEIAFQNIAEARKNKTQYEALYRIRRADNGEIRWMRSVGKYFYNEHDEPVTLTGISLDVTEQKIAEERFRTLAETLPQLVWMSDANGNYDYASKQWGNYTGIDPSTENAWEKIIHPEDAARVGEAWLYSLKTGITFQAEARLKSSNGIYRWYAAKAEPVKDQAGKITQWIGAYTDVHEQKMLTTNLESAVQIRTSQLGELNTMLQKKNLDLENTQNFLQQLIDSSIEFICVVDSNLNILTVNKKFEQIRGILKKDVVGKSLFEISPKAKNSNRHESILKSLRGETVYLPKKLSLDVEGLLVDTYFVPLVLQGSVEGVIIMSRDVTDMAKSEQMLAEKNFLLERSNQDLQQFAHVASHDLKEPLRKMQIFASRIETDASSSLSAESKVSLSKIIKGGERMTTMVESILNYSSADANLDLRESVSLEEIVDSIKMDLELLIQQKRAVITCQDLPVIQGSQVLLFQLFYNLVNNALKFSDKKAQPVIEIMATSEQPGSVLLTFKDNGIGFDREYAEKIFETFSRLNPKDVYEGTGLGLALCRKIVERHHGKIWAKGELGKGATFFIRLPISQDAEP